MRNNSTAVAGFSVLLCGLSGCIWDWGLLDDPAFLGANPAALSLNSANDAGAASSATLDSGTSALSGIVSEGEFLLFEYEAGEATERIRVESDSPFPSGGTFVVALFDAEMNLLARSPGIFRNPLDHVLRRPTQALFIGVAPASGSSGGDFQLQLSRESTGQAPSPRPQVVYLNFAGGSDIRVHARSGLSFDSFDASQLGDPYAGQDQTIRAAILDTMRDDYAGFNVRFVTSDEGPPTGPYTTLHFGGEDSGLLGLADNVDRYNADLEQTAVIYVGTFASFSTMRLDPQEMGAMIGNVASHELGHLLGLYHTRNPDDVMDTTGTAWDLAGEQRFLRVALEETVFPTGMENTPMLLADAVGVWPKGSLKGVLDGPSEHAKNGVRRAIRRFAEDELQWACGTCAPGAGN